MIDRILEFSVKQRLLVVIATLVLIAFGLLAVTRIPIDAFPDVTNVQVQVLAEAGGMSPPEVEQLVTFPIEVEIPSSRSIGSKRSFGRATGFRKSPSTRPTTSRSCWFASGV
jgi:cobalt-zinc-cadmium resistance protein CzcA